MLVGLSNETQPYTRDVVGEGERNYNWVEKYSLHTRMWPFKTKMSNSLCKTFLNIPIKLIETKRNKLKCEIIRFACNVRVILKIASSAIGTSVAELFQIQSLYLH